MRIKQEDLAGFIAATLASIKAGVEAARDAGLLAELPEKVEFSGIEIIHSEASLSNVVTSTVEGSKTSAGEKPQIVETTAKTGGGAVVQETGTDTNTRALVRTTADQKTVNGTDTGTTSETSNDAIAGTSSASKTTTQNETSTAQINQNNTQQTNALENDTTTKSYH